MNYKETLIKICKKSSEERKQEIINYLNNTRCSFIESEECNNIIIPSKKNNIIVLTAHYDVYGGSYGYTDNGVGILILLNILKKIPNNVEVLFSNLEEYGGIGADYYLHCNTKNIIGCINIDCCGIGDYVYCDNRQSNILPINCKIGKMPFCDSDIYRERNIPTLTFSTSYKKLDFDLGLIEICKTIHNREQDNNIDLINFELIDLVSTKILETIDLFNATKK